MTKVIGIYQLKNMGWSLTTRTQLTHALKVPSPRWCPALSM
jgi:hypothetical protein